jgi:hypothetical protein
MDSVRLLPPKNNNAARKSPTWTLVVYERRIVKLKYTPVTPVNMRLVNASRERDWARSERVVECSEGSGGTKMDLPSNMAVAVETIFPISTGAYLHWKTSSIIRQVCSVKTCNHIVLTRMPVQQKRISNRRLSDSDTAEL